MPECIINKATELYHLKKQLQNCGSSNGTGKITSKNAVIIKEIA